MTTIKGLFAAGECDFSQHGGNRLGANSLLSAIYGGTVAGPNAIKYVENIETSYTELDDSIYQNRVDEEQNVSTNYLICVVLKMLINFIVN